MFFSAFYYPETFIPVTIVIILVLGSGVGLALRFVIFYIQKSNFDFAKLMEKEEKGDKKKQRYSKFEEMKTEKFL